MPSFASFCSATSSKASPVTKIDTVKPIPASAPMPTIARQLASLGSAPTRSRTASHVAAVHSDQLADDESGDDAIGDRRRRGVRDRVDRDGDPGVGQREQRHDHEARPRVEPVLEPFDDRLGLAAAPPSSCRCQQAQRRRRRALRGRRTRGARTTVATPSTRYTPTASTPIRWTRTMAPTTASAARKRNAPRSPPRRTRR